jgi:hypothetical protein
VEADFDFCHRCGAPLKRDEPVTRERAHSALAAIYLLQASCTVFFLTLINVMFTEEALLTLLDLLAMGLGIWGASKRFL